MKRYRTVVLASAAGFFIALALACWAAGSASAAEGRGPGGRGPDVGRAAQEAPRRNGPPADWSGWGEQQRRDWQQRMEREAPPDFFPGHWQDWGADRRARWWRNWAQGNDEEGIFAVAVPSNWKGWSDDHREKWWLTQVWRHRLRLLLDQEMDGLLPWAFPSPLPSGWERWNSAEKDEWLHSDSPGHWDDGVLIPKNWNEWKQDRQEAWWDDIADRCGFDPADIFPRGWDSWKKDEHEAWWGPMVSTGVGYLASSLPYDWGRWRDSERESWLRGVLAAKENVALRAHARLSAALGSMERAARRGVAPSEVEEMGHQGLMHGLAPDRFRAFGAFVVGRAGQGMRGEDLRREMRDEADREGRGTTAPPGRPGDRGTMGGGPDRGSDRGRDGGGRGR